MIRADKLENAIHALEGLLVCSRAMVENGESMEQLAEVLDYAEYLPPLLASPDDRTDEYRGLLESLTARHPAFALALQRFDAPRPPNAWWA
jgi:hypothetical protein